MRIRILMIAIEKMQPKQRLALLAKYRTPLSLLFLSFFFLL